MINQTIDIKKPHPGQKKILDSKARFKLIRCGRRFGKTEIAKRRALITGYQNSLKFGYFCPTYKMLAEVWRNLTHILKPVILKKDEHLHQIVTLNGGVIDFWSLENPDAGRGRDYDEVIIDEAAYINDLYDIWNKVIRPTLIDRKGKALFLSTPNGYENDFKKLEDIAAKSKDWEIFHMPSSTNPRIPLEEIEAARLELPKDVFAQEFLAEYILFKDKLFADQYDPIKHISYKAVIDPNNRELYLSFDFNITLSCLVIQYDHNYTHFIKEYHNEGWDLQRLCQEIETDFPGFHYFINGDASGNNRSALTSGNKSAYDIISGFMRLPWERFIIPTVNPSYINSRLQTNFLLKNDNILINPECERLIDDLSSVRIDDKQSIDTWKKKNPKKGHIFDCFRYHLNAHHANKLSQYSNR